MEAACMQTRKAKESLYYAYTQISSESKIPIENME